MPVEEQFGIGIILIVLRDVFTSTHSNHTGATKNRIMALEKYAIKIAMNAVFEEKLLLLPHMKRFLSL